MNASTKRINRLYKRIDSLIDRLLFDKRVSREHKKILKRWV